MATDSCVLLVKDGMVTRARLSKSVAQAITKELFLLVIQDPRSAQGSGSEEGCAAVFSFTASAEQLVLVTGGDQTQIATSRKHAGPECSEAHERLGPAIRQGKPL